MKGELTSQEFRDEVDKQVAKLRGAGTKIDVPFHREWLSFAKKYQHDHPYLLIDVNLAKEDQWGYMVIQKRG